MVVRSFQAGSATEVLFPSELPTSLFTTPLKGSSSPGPSPMQIKCIFLGFDNVDSAICSTKLCAYRTGIQVVEFSTDMNIYNSDLRYNQHAAMSGNVESLKKPADVVGLFTSLKHNSLAQGADKLSTTLEK